MCPIQNRRKPPWWAAEILQKVNTIMALVQVDDSVINALATSLQDIGTNLAAEIAALKSQPALADADFSGVDAQVTALQALEVPAPAP